MDDCFDGEHADVGIANQRSRSTGLLEMETDLSQHYAGEQAGEINEALQDTWLGRGVGTSTGVARSATNHYISTDSYEGYYARGLAELGIIGCAMIVAFQCLLLILALRARGVLRGTDLESYCDAIAAMTIVFLVYSYKGAVLSLDPANMLYWLFAGVLFSLPRLTETNVVGQIDELRTTHWEVPSLTLRTTEYRPLH